MLVVLILTRWQGQRQRTDRAPGDRALLHGAQPSHKLRIWQAMSLRRATFRTSAAPSPSKPSTFQLKIFSEPKIARQNRLGWTLSRKKCQMLAVLAYTLAQAYLSADFPGNTGAQVKVYTAHPTAEQKRSFVSATVCQLFAGGHQGLCQAHRAQPRTSIQLEGSSVRTAEVGMNGSSIRLVGTSASETWSQPPKT